MRSSNITSSGSRRQAGTDRYMLCSLPITTAHFSNCPVLDTVLVLVSILVLPVLVLVPFPVPVPAPFSSSSPSLSSSSFSSPHNPRFHPRLVLPSFLSMPESSSPPRPSSSSLSASPWPTLCVLSLMNSRETQGRRGDAHDSVYVCVFVCVRPKTPDMHVQLMATCICTSHD